MHVGCMWGSRCSEVKLDTLVEVVVEVELFVAVHVVVDVVVLVVVGFVESWWRMMLMNL